ncbi:adenylosuccinate lyase [Streptomyces albireticuli]|uniref:Adenylosuccinate lyase n=1 Tax=Streptomyces albireticuli TaxID=1940 RepID=A0A2A2DBT4_9ACTN|nr:adenylosuccinate lyase [Streptomyces albireticuli]MCD9194732.1 adenylosuccinate lyase [Streptomyces albireticuli]PAU49938.1 adenylosuccinate lyase [Streptomyces albireticuli]
MIPRYSRPEMARLWTDEAKYASWVRVEVLACEAQARLGRMSEADLAAVRSGRVPTPEEVREQERTRDHEILAFLAAYTASVPDDAARWVHYGMTSYDLVDTALGHTLAASTDLLLAAAARLRDVLASRAAEHWDTVCVARTHGIHAEPTTFGQKLAGFAFGVHRSVVRLRAARAAVAVGTISGPVGTYASVDPFVESYVCEALGLGVEPVPTQVVARDRHAELLGAVAVLGAVVEQIALEMRLLQRTEVREVEEPRSSAYQGSSAMPHKRNPTSSERLCGLARVLRANLGAALENVALWHERDLAHSSVERVVLPDSLIAAHYQVTAAAELVEGLRVFPDRMRANLDATAGLIHSSTVMLRLMAEGSEREKAYRSVQDAATETWETGRHLRETLRDRGIVTGEDDYDPTRFLRSRDAMRRRLEELLHVEM